MAYVAQQYIWHSVTFWCQHFQYLLYCWQCHVSKIQREYIVMFLWQCTYSTSLVPFTFWHMCLQNFISYLLDIFEMELENNIIASVIMWKYKVQSYSYYCCIKVCALFSVDTCSCKLQASLSSPPPKIVGNCCYKLWWRLSAYLLTYLLHGAESFLRR